MKKYTCSCEHWQFCDECRTINRTDTTKGKINKRVWFKNILGGMCCIFLGAAMISGFVDHFYPGREQAIPNAAVLGVLFGLIISVIWGE